MPQTKRSDVERACKECGTVVPSSIAGLRCRDCKLAYNKRYYEARHEQLCADQRARTAKNRDGVNAAARVRYRKNVERYREQTQRWKRENPEAHTAHIRVMNALAARKLKKASACEQCGVLGRRLDAHHRDYAKPLEVEWICVSCHKREHVGVGVAA